MPLLKKIALVAAVVIAILCCDSTLRSQPARMKANQSDFAGSFVSSPERPATEPRVMSRYPFASSAKADRWFSEDKFMHFQLSAILVFDSFIVLRGPASLHKDRSLVVSSAISATAGIAKELFDLNRKSGTASFKDLAADFIGIATAVFFIKSFD